MKIQKLCNLQCWSGKGEEIAGLEEFLWSRGPLGQGQRWHHHPPQVHVAELIKARYPWVRFLLLLLHLFIMFVQVELCSPFKMIYLTCLELATGIGDCSETKPSFSKSFAIPEGSPT